jgi:hypothetical protein
MRFVKAAIVATGVSAATLAATVPEASAAPGGVPSGHVTPNPSAPGTATTFDVFCGRDAMSATLFGVTLGLADLILMHSTARTMPGEFVVTVTLPANIAPGGYRPSFDCSNGNAGAVTFRVDPVPAWAPETGGGATATATGTPLAPFGYSLIGLGALTGGAGVALRRRWATQRH